MVFFKISFDEVIDDSVEKRLFTWLSNDERSERSTGKGVEADFKWRDQCRGVAGEFVGFRMSSLPIRTRRALRLSPRISDVDVVKMK
jgi:hypothetical protein